MLTHTTKFALHVSWDDTEAVASHSVKQHMLNAGQENKRVCLLHGCIWTGNYNLLIVQPPNWR